MQDLDFDFIGFTYNGKHSIKDLGIYRVSNGNRYDENLLPTLKEKTAVVAGMPGMYYFGTDVQQRQFSIPFAFQGLSEQKMRCLKQIFNGDGIHDLIFDENPYKVYSAKVTGSATAKYICFESEWGRSYNGEGTLQFTCYCPYAHTPNTMPTKGTSKSIEIAKYESNGESPVKYVLKTDKYKSYNCGIFIKRGEGIKSIFTHNCVESITISYKIGNRILVGSKDEVNAYLTSNKTDIYIHRINYTMKNEYGSALNLKDTPKIEIQNGDVSFTYNYIEDNGCYEIRLGDGDELSGKVLNHYSEKHFPTKSEWGLASDLPFHTEINNNIGDVSTTFKLNCPNTALDNLTGDEDKKWSIVVGSNRIDIQVFPKLKYSGIEWDSKTGLVIAEIEGDNAIAGKQPIPFIGNSCCTIPVTTEVVTVSDCETPSSSDTSISGNTITVGSTLSYNYWYY